MGENDNSIWGVDDVFGTLDIIRIVSDVEKFKDWLRKEHKIENFEVVFDGYKFFLESAVRSFLHVIIYNYTLDIEEDPVFRRARFVGIHLSKIPNTCEKTMLIKNINHHLKLIKRSKNFEELKSVIINFKSSLDVFWKIYNENVAVNKKISIDKGTALKYLTMFYTHIFLGDTSRSIPHGYWVSMLYNNINPEQHKKNLNGYKYALQFTWSILLEEKYYSTSIVNLHKAKDWSGKYDSLYSYCWKIYKEAIEPIEKELKIGLGLTKILYLEKKISKEIFKDLLRAPKEPQLNEKEKLDCALLWYDIEFLDSSKSHIFNGVPAFISLLVGTAELKSRFPEKGKAYICKFIHPDKSVNGNDFSYGILMDAFGSTGLSDYSGWILFFDCCGDYSGFAGSEHAMVERFINKYKNNGIIEVIEITINKNKLKEYIADKITTGKRDEIMQILEEESRARKERNIISEARGLVLELVTYYTLSKKIYDLIDWNIKMNKDQLDVILETKDDFILIECITNPNNEDMNKEINILKTKLNNYNTNKNKKCVFWFWERPHQIVIDNLNSHKIEHKVVSELIKDDPSWKNKKMDKLTSIFGIKN